MGNLMTGAEMVFKALEDQGVNMFLVIRVEQYCQSMMN